MNELDTMVESVEAVSINEATKYAVTIEFNDLGDGDHSVTIQAPDANTDLGGRRGGTTEFVGDVNAIIKALDKAPQGTTAVGIEEPDDGSGETVMVKADVNKLKAWAKKKGADIDFELQGPLRK